MVIFVAWQSYNVSNLSLKCSKIFNSGQATNETLVVDYEASGEVSCSTFGINMLQKIKVYGLALELVMLI